MPRLIINADDLGVNAQRSHGIFQCFECGVVTSATLLANGTDSDAAGKRAKEKKLPCGLHLNLTEEYPRSKAADIASLIEGNGMFMDRYKLRMALAAGDVRQEHIEREIRAQVEWMLDVHGSITHVDGHHHIHIEPAVAQALLPTLERYGIRFVRIPCELPLPPWGYIVPDEQLERTRHINARALQAKQMYAAHWIGTTDHFRGLTLAGNAALKNLRHIISKLPDGTTELMVHPGSPCTYGTAFDLHPQRQTELCMLLDPSISTLLTERKIELIAFADL